MSEKIIQFYTTCKMNDDYLWTLLLIRDYPYTKGQDFDEPSAEYTYKKHYQFFDDVVTCIMVKFLSYKKNVSI